MAKADFEEGRHKTTSAIRQKVNEVSGSQFWKITGGNDDGELTMVADEGTKNERKVVLAQVLPHPDPIIARKGQLALFFSESKGGIDPITNNEKVNVATLALLATGSNVNLSSYAASHRMNSENTAASRYLHSRLTWGMGMVPVQIEGESINAMGNDGIDGYEHHGRAYTSPFFTSEMIKNMPKTQLCVHGSNIACDCGSSGTNNSRAKSSKKNINENEEGEFGFGGEDVGFNLEEEHLRDDDDA